MELSLDKNIAFFAGFGLENGGSSKFPVLSAVEFNKDLQLASEKRFPTGYSMDEFSSMVRAKNSNCLILGMFKDVKVVRFMNGMFYEIFNFNNLHRSFINDLFLLDGRVYTLCKDDDYIGTIEFEKEL
jgi:hypothetical protein